MASSSRAGPGRFAIGAGLRMTGAGLLVFACALAIERGLWATALVAAGAAALLALDLARSATAADRALSRFIDSLAGEADERPIPQPGLPRTAQAIERALARVAEARAERQRRIDHLEALIDNVTAALVVLDAAGDVVSANRAARRTLAVVPGAWSGAAALPADTAQRLQRLAPGAREIVRLADGRAMLAQAASFTAAGRPLKLLSLQSLSGELDAVELKAWQDLFRVLAHEMMNSLTPICSLSESLEARLRAPVVDTAALAEDAMVIGRRSLGLMRFVGRYRTLTDVPAPELVEFSAAELVARLDRLMAPMMAQHGVDYASSIAPRRLLVTADPELLEQALINLLKNALEAVTGRPGAAVRLACQSDEGRPLFIVEDNGPGLPHGDPEGAFVPFFTTKAGGSGVGLTFARQVALMHGGRLVYVARSPTGAIFRLVLGAG